MATNSLSTVATIIASTAGLCLSATAAPEEPEQPLVSIAHVGHADRRCLGDGHLAVEAIDIATGERLPAKLTSLTSLAPDGDARRPSGRASSQAVFSCLAEGTYLLEAAGFHPAVEVGVAADTFTAVTLLVTRSATVRLPKRLEGLPAHAWLAGASVQRVDAAQEALRSSPLPCSSEPSRPQEMLVLSDAPASGVLVGSAELRAPSCTVAPDMIFRESARVDVRLLAPWDFPEGPRSAFLLHEAASDVAKQAGLVADPPDPLAPAYRRVAISGHSRLLGGDLASGSWTVQLANDELSAVTVGVEVALPTRQETLSFRGLRPLRMRTVAGDARPVSGADVRVESSDGRWATARTDVSGGATVFAPPGAVHVEARAAGHESVELSSVIGPGGGDLELVLPVQRRVRFRLRALHGGEPVVTALTCLASDGLEPRCKVSRSEYGLHVAPVGAAVERVVATMVSPGMETKAELAIDLEPGLETDVGPLELTESRPVLTLVTDASSGDAVAGATVRTVGRTHGGVVQGVTDVTGHALLHSVPERETLLEARVSGERFVPGRRWLAARRPDGAAALALPLRPCGAVEGEVIDASGTGVAGVRVELQAVEQDWRGAGQHEAWTDSVGRYRVEGLAPGEYRLGIAGDPAGASPKTVSVTAGTTSRADLELEGATVTGVLLVDGVPTPGRVGIAGAGPQVEEPKTAFRLVGVPGGKSVEVVAWIPDERGSGGARWWRVRDELEVPNGVRAWHWDMKVGSSQDQHVSGSEVRLCNGWVRDAESGSGIGGLDLLLGRRSGGAAARGRTDASGYFEIWDDVQSGQYTLAVGRIPSHLAVESIEGLPFRFDLSRAGSTPCEGLEVTVEQAAPLSVKVVDAGSVPITGARVLTLGAPCREVMGLDIACRRRGQVAVTDAGGRARVPMPSARGALLVAWPGVAWRLVPPPESGFGSSTSVKLEGSAQLLLGGEQLAAIAADGAVGLDAAGMQEWLSSFTRVGDASIGGLEQATWDVVVGQKRSRVSVARQGPVTLTRNY